MKTVPREAVIKIFNRVDTASEAEANALARRMQEEQPFILVYLLACEQEIDDEQEPGWLLYLGGAVYEVMASRKPDLRQVTGDELDQADDANLRFLEKMEPESEMHQQNAFEKLFFDYNQMPLLGVVVETLMAGNEETPELAGDGVGMGLLSLKTVIDCLDQ